MRKRMVSLSIDYKPSNHSSWIFKLFPCPVIKHIEVATRIIVFEYLYFTMINSWRENLRRRRRNRFWEHCPRVLEKNWIATFRFWCRQGEFCRFVNSFRIGWSRRREPTWRRMRCGEIVPLWRGRGRRRFRQQQLAESAENSRVSVCQSFRRNGCASPCCIGRNCGQTVAVSRGQRRQRFRRGPLPLGRRKICRRPT